MSRNKKNSKATIKAFSELQTAFDYFNKELFDGQLPDCMITLDNKGVNNLGYFSEDRYESVDGETKDNIAMNPVHLISRPLMEVFSTLVHEMCHLWEAHEPESKSARAYHSKRWGSKMESIGLMPSNTGEPGGKRTGQKMTHYVIEGGKFKGVCQAFIDANNGITWGDREAPVIRKKSKSKFKYTCPVCGAIVWGRPNLDILCKPCGELFEIEPEGLLDSNLDSSDNQLDEAV
jgi:predicted SprT family Zn-dependent metalloprotease